MSHSASSASLLSHHHTASMGHIRKLSHEFSLFTHESVVLNFLHFIRHVVITNWPPSSTLYVCTVHCWYKNDLFTFLCGCTSIGWVKNNPCSVSTIFSTEYIEIIRNTKSYWFVHLTCIMLLHCLLGELIFAVRALIWSSAQLADTTVTVTRSRCVGRLSALNSASSASQDMPWQLLFRCKALQI